MKKIPLFVFASFISLIFICQRLFAADAGQFYVGMDVGSSMVKGNSWKNEPAFIPGQKFKDADSAYGLRAGFQFNDWFATELGFRDFGGTSHRFKLREDIFFLVQPNDTQTVDAKGVSLTGVFSYRPTTNFSLIGVVGITTVDFDLGESGGYSPFTGSLSQRDNFSEQGLVYGIGARYVLNNSYSLRAEVSRNDAGDFTIDHLGLGVEYSF
ncbi:MAG: porin family protein [Gammaproteobacteria bacterium]|nr:MAG: porin family protein [Gammaproteobacteria bacterium]